MSHQPQTNIRKLARTARRTGQIPAELVRNFDQDGKWIGDRRAWPISTVRSIAQVMRGVFLPISQRSRTENGRRILLTSLNWDREAVLFADWHEIQGNVILGPRSGFVNQCLDTVLGSLTGVSVSKVELPQLYAVGRDFGFSSAAGLVKTPLLRHVGGALHVRDWNPLHLKTVGGSFSIWNVLDTILPNLLRVGHSIYGVGCQGFQAPILEEIGGNFYVDSSATSISIPKLRKVPGFFFALTATRIDAPRLSEVGDDAFTGFAPEFAPLSFHVGGIWHINEQARTMIALRLRARKILRGEGDLNL